MAGKKVVGELIASIRLYHAQLETDMKAARKKFTKLGKDIDKIGRDLSRKFGLTFASVGTAAFVASKQIEDAFSTIRRGTGQTGKALDGLKKDFLSVSKGVPDSFQTVARAVADLNSRLNLTGQPLQKLATQTINLARITGSDLGAVIQTNTRVFGDWSIKLEDTAEAQDYLFKVSQSTGIGITRLGDLIVKYGAPLRQFGFSFEEAAALMGKFDKEGVNTEIVFSGIRQALGRLSKAGIELKPGLASIMEGIKNAGSAALANQAAIKIFGQEAGPDMAAAIREGRFAIDDMIKSLKDSSETINKAADESQTFTEKLRLLGKAILTALAPVGDAITRALGPVVDFLTTAFNWLAEVMQTKFGKAVAEVVVVLGGLAAAAGPVILAIKGIMAIFGLLIGWPAVIIASFAGLYVAWQTWGDDVLKFFTDLWNDVSKGFDFIKAKVFQFNQFLSYIGDLNSPFAAWDKATQDFDWAMGQLSKKWSANIQGARDVQATTDKYAGALKGAQEQADKLKGAQDEAGQSGINFQEILDKIGKSSGGASKALENQAKKVAQLKQDWSDYVTEFTSSSEQDSFQKGIESALQNFDKASFDSFAEKMRQSIEDEAFKKLGDKYKDIIPESEIRSQAQKEAQIRADEFKEQWGEKQKEVYQDGIDLWRSLFENAITGVTFDLEDALKQVAVGFAAEVANALVGGLGGLKIDSPQGLGGALGQLVLGQFGVGGGFGSTASTSILGDSIGKGVGEALGIGAGTGGLLGSFGGGAGVLLADGSVVAAGSEAAAAGIGSAALPGSGLLGAVGPWGLAAAGLLAVGSQTDWFGLANSGPTNPETIARKKFTEKLEEITGKLNGLKFIDEAGNAQVITDFKSRSTAFGDFNNPDWAKQYQSKYGDNASIFSGVGNALAGVLGIDNIPLEQVGPLLAESLGGSLEGLKALINQVGASAADMEAALLEAGKAGNISWLEFESSLQAVDQAMQPGLTAVGAFGQAFDNLLKTGARGQIALDQLKNVAIEAQEAGLGSLQDLQTQLAATGQFTAEQITGLMQALSQRGIQSLEDLANAPDRVLGGIIADMQALGVQFTDALSPLQQAKEALEAIPDNVEKNIHFNITGSVDGIVSDYVTPNIQAAKGFVAAMGGGQVTAFAKGGIISGPTMFNYSGGTGIMGEAGPEAIVPLKRGAGGRLGIEATGNAGNVINIHVDASGDGDAEIRVRRAIMEMHDELMAGVMRTVEDNHRRNRYEY